MPKPNAGFARTPEATGRGFAAPDNDVLRAEHPVESQSRRPAAKVLRFLAKSGVERGMISLANSSCQQYPNDLFNNYGRNAIQA